MKAQKSSFSLDTDTAYEGFTFGETWNGHACPLFTFEVAKKIAKECSCVGNTIEHDPLKDAFVFNYENEELEYCYPTEVIIDGIPMSLYDIGAYSWCWWDNSWK